MSLQAVLEEDDNAFYTYALALYSCIYQENILDNCKINIKNSTLRFINSLSQEDINTKTTKTTIFEVEI